MRLGKAHRFFGALQGARDIYGKLNPIAGENNGREKTPFADDSTITALPSDGEFLLTGVRHCLNGKTHSIVTHRLNMLTRQFDFVSDYGFGRLARRPKCIIL